MRLSIIKTDPGYDVIKIFTAQVYLDGEKLKYCYTADEEEGFVDIIALDSSGHSYPNPNCPEKIMMLRRFGKVEIKFINKIIWQPIETAPNCRIRLKLVSKGGEVCFAIGSKVSLYPKVSSNPEAFMWSTDPYWGDPPTHWAELEGEEHD